jgi:hypothetical protein
MDGLLGVAGMIITTVIIAHSLRLAPLSNFIKQLVTGGRHIVTGYLL